MTSTDEIVRDLSAADPSIRNAAALRMIDARAVGAIPALSEAIARADNVGSNGTLVYALGHFDCSEHFQLLVSVALRHRFEASMEARRILAEHDFVLQDHQLEECGRWLGALRLSELTDSQRQAMAEIRDRFLGFPSDP